MTTNYSHNIAKQICELLNTENHLTIVYTPTKIINSPTQYIFNIEQNKVIGVIGIEQNNYLLTRIKHLSVSPNRRTQGLGTKLVIEALKRCSTKFAYCTIKENNSNSLRIFKKVGFEIVGSYTTEQGEVFLLVKSLASTKVGEK